MPLLSVKTSSMNAALSPYIAGSLPRPAIVE